MNVCCHVEIEFDQVRAWRESRSIEVPLRRTADGTLTAECRAVLTSELKHLLPSAFLGYRNNVLCAISSRGLSLRRVSIPKSIPEQRRQLLTLQIESEFPLPPAQLAWGAVPLNGHISAGAHPVEPTQAEAAGRRREDTTPNVAPDGVKSSEAEHVLVVAIKRDALREFVEVLKDCGATAIFTPAAMARALLCPATAGKTAVLEIGKTHTELLVMENNVPTSLRILSWGLRQQLAPGDRPEGALRQATEELAEFLRAHPGFQRLWIGGTGNRQVAPVLSQLLGSPCEPLLTPDSRISTALAGMQVAAEHGTPLVELETEAAPSVSETDQVSPALKKWGVAAVVLACCALLLPHLEAWLMKPRLEKILAAVRADRTRLKQIDDELAFLRHLKQSQPSYIDALYLISRSAPPGTRFDALSLNRQGALSLKASMRDGNQVAEFRAKLLNTGLFSNLALEEQTPTPDRQKLTIRMSGQWNPAAAHELATAAASKEPDPPSRPTGTGGATPGDMPMPMPGMPPGMALPMVPGGAPPPGLGAPAAVHFSGPGVPSAGPGTAVQMSGAVPPSANPPAVSTAPPAGPAPTSVNVRP